MLSGFLAIILAAGKFLSQNWSPHRFINMMTSYNWCELHFIHKVPFHIMKTWASHGFDYCSCTVITYLIVNLWDLQSRTKLLENLYPFMHTIERNTISTTTDLRYQIPLPPCQCCFLQMFKDQGCFRTHNNIASKGRGEGRTRYSEDDRKNALRMWHFLNSFVLDCSTFMHLCDV